MKTKKGITAVTAKRYRKQDKKCKTAILDEFVKTTGYNRKYAVHLLANWGKSRFVEVEGKPVELKAGNPKGKQKRRPGGGRPRIYGDDVIEAVREIWKFSGYPCGVLLEAKIKLQIEFFAQDKELAPLFTDGVKEKLAKISASTIDKRLAPERKKPHLKGKSLTKPGTLLKSQIPVRTFFHWDERKPGFFEIDTVSHCGANASGEFCSTLTMTDVYSGWTEVRSMKNRAHKWVKESVEDFYANSPFPMLGIDSDNGGEFINHQLILWCNKNGVQFTRGRPYRKNDNCFVEQKNGDIVRKTVGYHRYDTAAEHEALAKVYEYLCPLINYWSPSLKIIGKIKLENGRFKKKYDEPKTPFARLLESDDISDAVKTELKARAALTNPVSLQRLLNNAILKLYSITSNKFTETHG